MSDNPGDQEGTSLGHRFQVGAFNAAFWGGLTAAGSLAFNAISRKFFKSESPLFGKFDWALAGITAATTGAWSFYKADKNREDAVKTAMEAVNDPTNGLSKDEKQKQIESILKDSMNGKAPESSDKPSTKHQDKITAERAFATSATAVSAGL